MANQVVQLPHKYIPRAYQMPFWGAMEAGKKRAVLVDHRRAGKDKTCFNFLLREAGRRVGIYYYFFPTYNQGRKILWDGVDRDGFRFLDHIPAQLIKGQPNQTEMKVPLVNGSLVQVVGSDNIDSVVGTNPVGCVFSEYALQDPRGWDYISPILLENGGWAVFPYTPRGKNHGYRLYEMAKSSPDWYCEKLTVTDTWGRGGTISPDMIESERKRISAERGEDVADAFIEQEYFCSFNAAIVGAVYGAQLRTAEKEGRITSVPYDMAHPVNTYWDLGFGDATAIWFVQEWGPRIHFIDYHQANGVGMDYYVRMLREKKYVYGEHFAPHDVEKGELGSGKTIRAQASDLGLEFNVLGKLSPESGISMGRLLFNRCWFDADKCKKGLDALSFYHYEFDEQMNDFSVKPDHDWSSHAADAFRYFAMAHEDKVEWKKPDKYKVRQKRSHSWMSA